MKFNNYVEQIRLHMKEYLPREFKDSEVLIQQLRKNNDMLLHGMSLKGPNENICPVIYLEDYYALYQEGMAIEDTLRLIGKSYLSAQNSIRFQQDMDLSYDHMKDNLFLCVVNVEKNQEMLASVPHQKIEDLAVVYRSMIYKSNEQVGSVLINNTLLEEWGIDKETLHERALQNMNRLFTPEFYSLESKILNLMGIPYPEIEMVQDENGMFVLTNSQEYYGASYLCCPDVLKLVSEKMDGDFLILPSSVNEIIILKESLKVDISELQELVESVNQTIVRETEYLSDNVYRYDSQNQTLSIVDGNDMQQGMKLQH